MDDVLRGKGIQFNEEAPMIGKIKAGMSVLKTGEKVADPAKWKNRAIKSDLVAFLTACVGALSVFGVVAIEIPSEDMDKIAEALVAIVPAVGILFSTLMHLATSDKVGVQGKSKSDSE